MIGTMLQDKYRVERKIGHGGFASVYQGTHVQLKRPVAIKVLENAGEDGRFKTRLLREAESMAQLSHPNIVSVYDVGEHEGRPYIVMELVNGPSLQELIAGATLTLAQVCDIALQVCRAMSYAHAHGVAHRDLTLRNIMVSESGDEQQAKVLDFNLAKVLQDGATTTGRAMGTPYYMAPEQLRNEEAGPPVDIFAFGVGLYRILNGRFPFEAEHPAAIMYLTLNEFDLPFTDGIPDDMRDLVMHCLEKDPRVRAASFDELISDLERIRERVATVNGTTSSAIHGLSALVDRGSKRNPYLNRVMIRHPSEFIGRAREVRRIYSRLDAPHPQSISVVGERRIGKSSLLNYVYHPRNRRRHMQNHDRAIFVYLDFQRNADYDVPGFISFLFGMFSYELKDGRDFTGREKTLDQLREVVRELHDEGRRILIFMDEFELITGNESFNEGFFSFLRSLANSYHVAYVTSSHEDLQNLCHNKDISDSPFFNIFSVLPLRPFTAEEAAELVTQPSRAEGVPLEAHAARILEMAGHFPLYLQIACSDVFEYLVDHRDREPDWNEIEKTFVDEVEPHYRFVWDHLDEPSRDNLVRIATGKRVDRKQQFVNEALERRGYLVAAGEDFGLCSKTFRDFVVRQGESGRGKSFWSGMIRRR